MVVFSVVIFIVIVALFVIIFVFCLLNHRWRKKFDNVIEINMKDFCDVHNSSQTISISSKECIPCDNGYIHSLSTKVLATAVEDDSYIQSNGDISVTAESSF